MRIVNSSAALAIVAGPAAAQDAFAGKPLTIVIGFGTGGGYDQWGRTLARHIGRHLPGRPAVFRMRARINFGV